MIDQVDLRVQGYPARRTIGLDQRTIAAPYAPVDLGVLVRIHVEDRYLIQFAAVDVTRDRIDHRIPAVAGLQIIAGRVVETGRRRRFGAPIKAASALTKSARSCGAKISSKGPSRQGGRVLSISKF